jgi:hypothetical protein
MPSPKLHAVIIDNPLRLLSCDATMRLYRRALALKCERFLEEYGENILPVDTGDFVGTHLLNCERDDDGELWPITVARALSLGRCRANGIGFPPVDLLHHCEAQQYLPEVEQAIARAETTGTDLTYFSSWTAASRYRTMHAGADSARDSFMALLTHWYTSRDMSGWLAFAVKKYKTDRYMQFMGARISSDDIVSRYRNNEPSVLMSATGLSRDMLDLAERHVDMLANLTHYAPETV